MAVALVGEGDGGGRRWSGGEGVDTGEAGGAVDGGGRSSSSLQPPSASSSSLSQLPPPWPLAPTQLSPPQSLPREETGRSAAARAAAASPPAGSGGGEGATAATVGPPPPPLPQSGLQIWRREGAPTIHAVLRHHASLPAPPLSPLPDLTGWRRRPCQAGAGAAATRREMEKGRENSREMEKEREDNLISSECGPRREKKYLLWLGLGR
uniref:Uncharacterized protein n=1 Tax=Oryza sativa subsp. japonica TaxID=39947 RepID=Q2R0J1_ORYSJ|nr:hypothetical protein LOC_Os11g42400 [Oryza sativa Japonica Group]